MANTFGKANEESAWQNNKEMNPQVNSSVTDDVKDENDQEETWRPTDKPLESPTDSEFDEAEANKRNENVKTDSPGLKPDIGE